MVWFYVKTFDRLASDAEIQKPPKGVPAIIFSLL
jgi:hypothetical protein